MERATIKKLFDAERIFGNTIFHELAYCGSLVLLRRISGTIDEPCESILQQVNFDGEHSIHVVANIHKGNRAVNLIKALIEMGADLNARDQLLNVTVIHIAVEHRDYILAKWLCDQGRIDLNVKSVDGLTAYDIARAANDTTMMKILKGAALIPANDRTQGNSSQV